MGLDHFALNVGRKIEQERLAECMNGLVFIFQVPAFGAAIK